MSEITNIIKENLVLDERVISVVERLEFGFEVTPDFSTNFPCTYEGELALTNRRLIILFSDGECWKLISIAAINNISERPINENKPKWPYQAILGLPGGYGVILQTAKADEKQQKLLSALLVNAYLVFCIRTDDSGSIKAAAAEREKIMQQQLQQQQINNQALFNP